MQSHAVSYNRIWCSVDVLTIDTWVGVKREAKLSLDPLGKISFEQATQLGTILYMNVSWRLIHQSPLLIVYNITRADLSWF